MNALSLQDIELLRSEAYIAGAWRAAPTRFSVRNPANGEELAQVSDSTVSLADEAVAAASSALTHWRSKPAHERSRLLRAWRDLILQHAEDLALLMTLEQGKPLKESRGEVAYGAAFLEWFAEEGRRVYGDIIPAPAPDRRILVLKQPVGVCAAITPWNFPIAMITRKVAPALAAGCTVVVKPAEQTPLCALALAELAHRAGLPAGVFNVLPASATQAASLGKALCAHPAVRHLSFTGSTEVGRLLMAQCAPTLKKLSLELGGHAPFIVFDDADIDAAVEGAIASKYRNAGQTCVCANRFLLQESVYERFVSQLAARSAQLKTGDGRAPDTDIGPLIDDAAVEKVQRHIDDAVQRGSRLVVGNTQNDGRWMAPTVLADVKPDMLVMKEETFGPVAAVASFRDEAEAIRLANASEYGLAAYFYGRDMGRIWRVAEALEYGIVGVNTGLISYETAPFGGIKQSGFGREGSKYGIEEYLETKYVCLAGI